MRTGAIQTELMSVRKVRVIKQNNPLENERDYVRDHEKSLIALLVPEHIEYTQRVLEKVTRQRESTVPIVENFRLTQ